MYVHKLVSSSVILSGIWPDSCESTVKNGFVIRQHVFQLVDVKENHMEEIKARAATQLAIVNYLLLNYLVGYINYSLVKIIQKVVNNTNLDIMIEEYVTK